ncbi:MAG: TSUP family transporter, partial [Actinomyces sp.]|nr:TSUP family transporter [Actinomyces sp.]
MILHALLIGALVGVVVGSLSAGGGIVSVPILVYVLGQDPHQATGLSLIIVGLT